MLRQHDITEYIKNKLLKDKKCTISGFGTFLLAPTRKGKHYDMVKKEWVEGTTRKYRVKFKAGSVLQKWVKEIE